MRAHARLIVLATLVFAAGCATTASVPPLRSDLGEIPVLDGLSYRPADSFVMESRNVRAARLVYRGRLEPGSVAVELQKGLEAAGWRVVRTTSGSGGSGPGTIQFYEMGPASLQVQVWEGGLFGYYTYVEVSATRPIVAPAATAAR
jgi:hypothetical protein